MKKVLIYLHKDELAPTGGPIGYNYNLLQGLNEIGLTNEKRSVDICFLAGRSISSNVNSKINSIKNDWIKSVIKTLKSIYKKGNLLYGFKHVSAVDLNEYDAVHFHRTLDLYRVKDSLKDFKGKVILTSHTPTMPAKEVFSLLTDFEKKYMSWFYKRLPEIDEYAFDKADYIIFPCPEAEEPYYHEWPNYQDVHDRNKEKYLYMPTGTEKKVAKENRSDIRKKFNIPDDAFVVSYVGRHNEIKGYSDLKEIGNKILQKYSNIFFIIAGKEGPLFGLDNSRWIEVGWTNDPASIINSADMFLLPNRETYFDLVMLEVLSLGQIVLASNTGGNKYFSKFQQNGVILYTTNEEAEMEIENILAMTEFERNSRRQSNKELYEHKFTNKVFAYNYLSLLGEIL